MYALIFPLGKRTKVSSSSSRRLSLSAIGSRCGVGERWSTAVTTTTTTTTTRTTARRDGSHDGSGSGSGRGGGIWSNAGNSPVSSSTKRVFVSLLWAVISSSSWPSSAFEATSDTNFSHRRQGSRHHLLFGEETAAVTGTGGLVCASVFPLYHPYAVGSNGFSLVQSKSSGGDVPCVLTSFGTTTDSNFKKRTSPTATRTTTTTTTPSLHLLPSLKQLQPGYFFSTFFESIFHPLWISSKQSTIGNKNNIMELRWNRRRSPRLLALKQQNDGNGDEINNNHGSDQGNGISFINKRKRKEESLSASDDGDDNDAGDDVGNEQLIQGAVLHDRMEKISTKRQRRQHQHQQLTSSPYWNSPKPMAARTRTTKRTIMTHTMIDSDSSSSTSSISDNNNHNDNCKKGRRTISRKFSCLGRPREKELLSSSVDNDDVDVDDDNRNKNHDNDRNTTTIVKYVLGVDEAGRGPLAGPVVAAAVYCPIDIPGIVDSKKITKEEDREILYQLITKKTAAHADGDPGTNSSDTNNDDNERNSTTTTFENEIHWAVCVVDAARIDEINILQATLEGMRCAVQALMESMAVLPQSTNDMGPNNVPTTNDDNKKKRKKSCVDSSQSNSDVGDDNDDAQQQQSTEKMLSYLDTTTNTTRKMPIMDEASAKHSGCYVVVSSFDKKEQQQQQSTGDNIVNDTEKKKQDNANTNTNTTEDNLQPEQDVRQQNDHSSLSSLSSSPSSFFALIDGNKVPKSMPCPSESIIKGDSKEFSIAAASILAKVTRDRLMNEYHYYIKNDDNNNDSKQNDTGNNKKKEKSSSKTKQQQSTETSSPFEFLWNDSDYSVYNFIQHKGYPTKQHIQAIMEYGPSPIHRKTFAPLKNMIRTDEAGKKTKKSTNTKRGRK